MLDTAGPLETWGQAERWAPSSTLGGTPGEDDGGFPDLGGRQLPGDSNQDSFLDIADAVSLLRRLYPGGDSLPLPCDGASPGDGGNLTLLDLNNDALVNLTDVVYLVNHLFQNGPAPVLGSACRRIEGCPNVCGF
jgi:hypothetical protein